MKKFLELLSFTILISVTLMLILFIANDVNAQDNGFVIEEVKNCTSEEIELIDFMVAASDGVFKLNRFEVVNLIYEMPALKIEAHEESCDEVNQAFDKLEALTLYVYVFTLNPNNQGNDDLLKYMIELQDELKEIKDNFVGGV